MFFKLPKKSIEFVCALAMIAAGVYFSATGVAGSATVIIGSTLSTLGGVLASWATVSLSSSEAAADMLRPQLSAIARQLVAVSGQISKSVSDAKSGEIDQTVALEMVSQASRIMYSSVNEIHVVLNEKVDTEELLGTAQRVEELAVQLAGSMPSSKKNVESEFLDAITDLRSKVQGISSATKQSAKGNKPIPKAAPHELQHIVEACPDCGKETDIHIGPAIGSSAMPECVHCERMFHAHRKKDWSVSTRAQGTNK